MTTIAPPVVPVVLPVDLRDYFAAKAMAVLVSADDVAWTAAIAYELADAMMRERARRTFSIQREETQP